MASPNRHVARRARRAGFTLNEIVIVLFFISFFVAFMSSSLVTANFVNNDTYYDGEVVGVATRALDELSAELSLAGEYTSIDANGEIFEFQHCQDADANLTKEVGVWDLRGAGAVWTQDVRWRAEFVQEGTLNETVAQADLNGDGDRTDTAVGVGRIDLILRNAGNTAAVANRTRSYGGRGSKTWIVRNPVIGGVVGRIFSRAGAVNTNVGVATPPTPAGDNDDLTVQINMHVVREPYPTANGGRTVQTIRLSRVVARR